MPSLTTSDGALQHLAQRGVAARLDQHVDVGDADVTAGAAPRQADDRRA